MANKWLAKLQTLDGAVIVKKDRFAKVIKTFSPSVNFIYGRTHGLPFGYTTVLYGPPKGGKSVLGHMMIGWLHQTDPDAVAIKIDTEFRTDGQLDDAAMELFGIDPDRIMEMQTNSPKDVFDQIEGKIAAFCHQGMPLKLIVIDSMTGVQGRREQDTESVEKQTIGDHAQTIQIGLKRILRVIRDHDIALVIVTQARAEMDMLEQKRGNKYKMQGSFGLQHFAEYFVVVERDLNAAGRKDLAGNALTNEGVKDLAGKSETVANKIKVKMKDSSMGPKGRTGEFTFHFTKGLINSHEEVFQLAANYKIVEHEKGGKKWTFAGETWNSEALFQEALKNRPELCDALMAELQRRDLAGEFTTLDAAAENDEE